MIDDIAGTAFPFAIDPATGSVMWASGTKKLRQNVRLILGVDYGDRPLLRPFGSRIRSLVHDPNDQVMAQLLQTQAQQAIMQFEPRVIVTQTQVIQTDGQVSMRLNYSFTTQPIADQLIVPLS
jgi:phage baseplate assembly protein W